MRQTKAEQWIKKITKDRNLLRLFIIMLASFALMTAIHGDTFFSLTNLQSMATQFPEIGILAIAVSLAMVLGGINLSVVGIANLSGILCCLTTIQLEPQIGTWPAIAVGVAVAILTGILCGLLNGVLIAYVGIPAMLATLGSQEIFRGLGVGITSGAAVFGMPDEFTFIGGKGVLGLPGPLLVFLVVVIAFTILLQKKQYGAELYLVGTSPKVAHFSGINNNKVVIMTHIYGGVLSAIAGIIIASRTNSAKASYGSSYVLQCLIIAILGGINPAGGYGKVSGVVMAVLTLQFLSSGFNMLRVDSYFKTFIWGAVLIGAMILNYVAQQMAENKKRRMIQQTIGKENTTKG